MQLHYYRILLISLTLCFVQTYSATGEPNSTDSSSIDFKFTAEWEVEFLELKNTSLVNWKVGFKSCGVPMEGCGKKQTDDRDYFIYPSFCRCDDECIKYGDCCVTVLKEFKKIPKEPSWRCVRLPNSERAVRMITKCPASFPNIWVKKLCEQPENCFSSISPKVNISHHCPLLDVPVVHKLTRDIYQSLFCARCHNITNKQLLKIGIPEQIICSDKFKQDTSWDEFKLRANYSQGKLEWVDPLDPTFTCMRQINEFQPENIHKYVPNVRFCPVTADEECSLRLGGEVGEEERVIHNLCHSYTQVVYGKEIAEEFKNPHCAKCKDPTVKIKKTHMCQRLSERYPTSPVDQSIVTDKPEVDYEDKDIDANKNYANSNFPVLFTLLSLSVFFLLTFLVAIYLLLSKEGLKKLRPTLSLYNNNHNPT